MSYWHLQGCRYDKLSRTCAEPDHIELCPLPGHDLRNGRLNQTAYGLFLFVRDIADDDFVGWIDDQLRSADKADDPDRIAQMRNALIEPLRGILRHFRQNADHDAVLHFARCAGQIEALG